ncbi:MAG TPA: PadR family transcriptional regulator, partial [Kofleriaceae bacterium]|nr:PadR family transcriptional regulator [Kofleriaceae bacterium]
GPMGGAAGGPGAWGHGHGPPGGPPWGGSDALRARMEMFRTMFGRGGRRGRGDVRAAILVLLAEQARNGYQIIQELERRSDGAWRPSSGSIYPTLQQLEDEGLVATETAASGRTFRLTPAGAKHVEEHREELGTPWATEAPAGGDPRREVMTMMGQLGPALGQVVAYGTPEQVAEARRIMTEARRALYRLLAEDDTEE